MQLKSSKILRLDSDNLLSWIILKYLVPFKSDNDSCNNVGDDNTFTDFDTNKSESALNDFNKDESNNTLTSFDNDSSEHTLKDFDSSRGIKSLLKNGVFKCYNVFSKCFWIFIWIIV